MDTLPGAVRQYAQRFDLFRQGEAVAAGVSGGPDSLCLLHRLQRLAPELGLRLHVAHLDHGLRGDAAAEDAQFVARFAETLALGAPCTVGRADVRGLAAAAGLSLEEAARQALYRFLAADGLLVRAGRCSSAPAASPGSVVCAWPNGRPSGRRRALFGS